MLCHIYTKYIQLDFPAYKRITQRNARFLVVFFSLLVVHDLAQNVCNKHTKFELNWIRSLQKGTTFSFTQLL